jgi:hypothetical protein
MMKFGKSAMTAMALSVLMAGLSLSGCQKQEGPAERAGKAIDKGVEKAGQQIEKAGENIQDAAKGAK